MANFSDDAIKILNARYLRKDKTGKVIETPNEMLSRVASHIAKAEGKKEKHWCDEFMSIMDTLEFLPNSPTLMNAGRELGQLSACFVLPVADDLANIFEMVKQVALIHKTGGGTGIILSHLRPSNSMVQSTSGVASGPTSFMRVFDTATDVVKQGGTRRGANMGILAINHPDIYEFIKCKEDITKFQNFNISVSITDNFLRAVKDGNTFPLRNPYTKEIRQIKAQELFDLICHEAWLTGEPGLVFIDTINKKNPIPELGFIEGTNPCVTGDTLIAVADGRGAVSIEQLVKEKIDVPIYCKDGDKTKIRMLRHPRLTGTKQKIYKVTFDSGDFVRVTGNHKFILSDGDIKQTIDLRPEDSINVLVKKKATFNEMLDNTFSSSQDYMWIKNGNEKSWKLEHRLIANFNKLLSNDYHSIVHHKDFNGLNNLIENLEVMTKKEHDLFHLSKMMGNNNPVIRFPEKNPFNDLKIQEKIRQEHHIGKKRSIITKKRIGLSTSNRFKDLSFVEKHSASVSAGMKKHWNNFEVAISKRAAEKLVECQSLTDLYCFLEGNRVMVTKKCEGCGIEFSVSWSDREISYHNHACWCSVLAKQRKGVPKKLFVYNNHKIISVIEDGYEDVYNGTVDEFHNLYIGGFIHDKEQIFINTCQCGEQPLLPYESCNLGSINVSKLVNNKKFDWDRLDETVSIAVRFLDDIIDINNYPNIRIARKTKLIRRIGLGVMGWADMLIALGIRYDSDKAIKLAERLMMNIRETAHMVSRDLGKEKGYCFKRLKRRNTSLTTIAPTGTLSILADCSSGIEPIFGRHFTKTVLGDVKLNLGKKYEKIDNNLLVTAHDVSIERHIEMQAAFQRYVDNAVSKTINLSNAATEDDVKKAFLLAHELECKGVTVYRDGSRAAPVEITTEGELSECENGRCPI